VNVIQKQNRIQQRHTFSAKHNFLPPYIVSVAAATAIISLSEVVRTTQRKQIIEKERKLLSLLILLILVIVVVDDDDADGTVAVQAPLRLVLC